MLPDEFRAFKQRPPKPKKHEKAGVTSIDIFEISEISARDVSPEERDRVFEKRWQQGSFNMLASFGDLITNRQANDFAVQFVHKKIREKVEDPAIAELLCPKSHPFGTKRLCVDTDYYETFNRDNVSLVDVRTAPIEKVTTKGLKSDSKEYALDQKIVKEILKNI